MRIRKLKCRLNQSGQGLIEYLILVALMAVATIGVLRVLNQNVNAKFANIIYSLQGNSKRARSESVSTDLYDKKSLGNFMKGAGSGASESNE